MKHAANILTASRIAASAALLFFPVESVPFWCLYAWCGLSDMVDGTVARKSGSQSAFGARLDSAADFAFAAACLIMLLTSVSFPVWLLIWFAVIALCKLAALIEGFALFKRPISLHTPANKVVGLLAFLGVPALLFSGCFLAAVPVCAAASFAAVQEIYLIRRGATEAENSTLRS